MPYSETIKAFKPKDIFAHYGLNEKICFEMQQDMPEEQSA